MHNNEWNFSPDLSVVHFHFSEVSAKFNIAVIGHSAKTAPLLLNNLAFSLNALSYLAEEEGSSFEDVEQNENILTLGLVGEWSKTRATDDHRTGNCSPSFVKPTKWDKLISNLSSFIVGHPNVGKSSVLNGLVGHKVCIVPLQFASVIPKLLHL